LSDIKLISPLLDNLDIGDRISGHDGVHCYPAMIRGTNEKYIVKVISIPASQTQLDALLLTGAYASEEDALQYFQDLATGLEEELQLLQRLSKLEGFISYENWQTMQKEASAGYDIYLLGAYRKTLQEHFERNPMTHLGAVNLGLDLCAALAVCRRAGYLYVDLKPSNIYILHDKEYKIGDLGFVRMDSLKYASLPDKYRSAYTAPEIQDAFSSLNTTLDIYAVGLILYQAYNNGTLPVMQENGVLPPPDYADYEMADIILKACATDPGSRWQDPLEMGQALISYMQRNSVNDTPIVPVAVSEESLEPMPQDLDAAEAQSDRVAEFASEANDHSEGEINDTVPDTQCDQATDQEAQSPIVATPSAPDSDGIFAYTEDDFGNLSFLLDKEDETDPSSLSEDMDYQDLSAEVSEILAQADELADHPVPEPVVAPDPVDITIPEPIVTDADSEDVDNPAQPDEVTEDNDKDQDPAEAVEITKQHEDVVAQEDETPPKRNSVV